VWCDGYHIGKNSENKSLQSWSVVVEYTFTSIRDQHGKDRNPSDWNLRPGENSLRCGK
jgi:hypothetical protein